MSPATGEACDPDCPFQKTLQMLGRPHTLRLLWETTRDETLRFNALRRRLALNPATLSARLKDLETEGILTRHVTDTAPPEVHYQITPKGRQLVRFMDQLERWVADTYDVPEHLVA